jgi:hypothetical protein
MRRGSDLMGRELRPPRLDGEPREPLVDSGIVQVALAVGAATFLLRELDGMRIWGTWLFAISALAGLLLYAVYLEGWIRMHRIVARRGTEDERWSFWIVAVAHLLTIGTVIAIYFLTLFGFVQ